MRDLEYRFSTETIDNAMDPQINARANTSVRSGPINSKANRIFEVFKGRVTAEQFAKEQAAESARPGLAFMAGPYGRVVAVGPLPAGTPSIRRSDGAVVTIMGFSVERDL